jgi:hypothetical protein
MASVLIYSYDRSDPLNVTNYLTGPPRDQTSTKDRSGNNKIMKQKTSKMIYPNPTISIFIMNVNELNTLIITKG